MLQNDVPMSAKIELQPKISQSVTWSSVSPKFITV